MKQQVEPLNFHGAAYIVRDCFMTRPRWDSSMLLVKWTVKGTTKPFVLSRAINKRRNFLFTFSWKFCCFACFVVKISLNLWEHRGWLIVRHLERFFVFEASQVRFETQRKSLEQENLFSMRNKTSHTFCLRDFLTLFMASVVGVFTDERFVVCFIKFRRYLGH